MQWALMKKKMQYYVNYISVYYNKIKSITGRRRGDYKHKYSFLLLMDDN